MSYFSRVTLLPAKHNRDQLVELLCADTYKQHQLLWKLFTDNPGADRDFIFRRDENYHGLRYFVVSGRKPTDDSKLWHIETKKYSPQLKKGQRLAFSVRVNPVVSKKTKDGKSTRHDVVIDAKKKMSFKNMSAQLRPHLVDIAQQAGEAWLKKRAEHCGFIFNDSDVKVDSYLQHRAIKKDNRISFSTLDITGILSVNDDNKMLQTLISGIGPAKAFGCGLMLVRRI